MKHNRGYSLIIVIIILFIYTSCYILIYKNLEYKYEIINTKYMEKEKDTVNNNQ